MPHKTRFVSLLVGGLSLFGRTAFADAAAPQAFVDGDRWCVLGDSITHSGSYHTWIDLYYVTRFPNQRLEVVNCGISGDSAAGALKRLQWDVLSHHPSVVSIMLGMNDVGRVLYADGTGGADNAKARQAKIQACEDNDAELVDDIQKTGAKVILITPSIFDETADIPMAHQTGVNEALGQIANYVTQLAADTGASVVDFYGPMNQVTKSLQEKNPKMTIVGKDRIHPAGPGHFLMAYEFLKAQGVPAEVARVTIDAPKMTVQDSTNGTVSELKIVDGGVTFTWLERALPYPIDPATAPALDWVPFVQDLDQETVQVEGLTPGAQYELSIDGAAIRRYSAEELSHGVNLATETATPQYQQAVRVSLILQERASQVVDRLRSLAQAEHQSAGDIPHPVTVAELAAPMAKRLAMLNATNGPEVNKRVLVRYPELKPLEGESIQTVMKLADEAYAQAQPKPHSYRIALARD